MAGPRKRVAIAVALLAAAFSADPQEKPAPAEDQAEARVRQPLEAALWQYFTEAETQGRLQAVARLAHGHDDLLTKIIKTKSFIPATGVVARHGVIDEQYRFVDAPGVGDSGPASGPVAGARVANLALFHGPATARRLCPFVVYVPDAVNTSGYERVIAREGTERGWYVFLVPDEQQDNKWNPSEHEHHRHVGPLRDFLLRYPIDPDRVFLIGTGRGGHATWDVGLLYADRWAGIFPCNGSLIHEGGYKASGGVFLENAKSLAVFMVYNTTFDHGIDACRYATRKLEEWGYRCESVEEPLMRNMGISEATEKLAAVTRAAHPREIVKRFNHVDAGDHYWLRALDRAPHEWDPKARITVRGPWPKEPDAQREMVWAQVRKECGWLKGSIRSNRVEVVAQGVGSLRIYFDPELVDYRTKVTVVVNGKARAPMVLEKSAEVMLQHVRETGDTERLYWAFREESAKE